MAIQQICELVKTGVDENIHKAADLAYKVSDCSSTEVDMLLECLSAKTAFELHPVLTALRQAKQEHARIVAALKPLLRHDSSAVVSSVLEMFAYYGDGAIEAGRAILDLTDALIEIYKTEDCVRPHPSEALETLAKISVDSKVVMRLVRKLNWEVPGHYTNDFDASVLGAALMAIGRHGEGDRQFTEATLLRFIKETEYFELTNQAFIAMLALAPGWPEMLEYCIESFSLPEIAKAQSFFVDFVFKSSLDPSSMMTFLLDLRVPFVTTPVQSQHLRDWLSWPRGYHLVRSEKDFPLCRPILQNALKGNDLERFRRAASFLTIAAGRFPDAAMMLAEEAKKCDQHKLGTLIECLINLDSPLEELQELTQRAIDNNWKTPEIDAARERIQVVAGLKSPISPGWNVLWSAPFPVDVEAEELVIANGLVCMSYRQVLEPCTSTTETNRERFGVCVARSDGSPVHLISAPLSIEFPKQPTAAAYMTRHWRAKFVSGNDLVCLMIDQDWEETGWKDRTFVYTLSLNDLKWSRLSSGGERFPLGDELISGERGEHAVGYGQIIIWPESDGKIGVFKYMEQEELPKEVHDAYKKADSAIEKSKQGYEADVQFTSEREFHVPVLHRNLPAFKVYHFDTLIRQITGRRWDVIRVISSRWTTNGQLALIVNVKGLEHDPPIARSFALLFGSATEPHTLSKK